MYYPGGKGKCFQHVINIMPPHDVYIEAFLGGGAVLRNKKPATISYGIDIDTQVRERWNSYRHKNTNIICNDAIAFLSNYNFVGSEVVYCDPPYLPETRKRDKVYRHDYKKCDHLKLLKLINKLNCRVIVSGYPSDLYEKHLRGWNSKYYDAKTHHGVKVEALWYNYDEPKVLHDWRYIGDNFRQREINKRRFERLTNRIEKLTTKEQTRLLEWLKVAVVE